MSVFIDTSAFFGVLVADDRNHKRAAYQWRRLLDDKENPVTSNYVVLETAVLLQNRIGIDAVRTFHEEILPVVKVRWVDERVHHAAVAMLLVADRKKLSLVDCASFQLMRDERIRTAFVFDRHFRELGFEIMP